MKKMALCLIFYMSSALGQGVMSPKDEACLEGAKTYMILIEKKAAKLSDRELLEIVGKTNLPPAQKSRLYGLIALLDGSEIRNKITIVQNFYMTCSTS